ncbi:hypothetical protein [uncultured Xanthomonas sp.]|uniref:hypothetical protein n=1 Tax=uncultured Xanthomonas sp. TaxID=152831 RepID=UPI0025ED0410|nr:hypothetical protein [uncultured Xanthomonas sp.]
MFLVILLVIAYKSNDALSHPQFWAEDATIFFQQQFGHKLPQLWVPYAGYLHAIPRLVAWVASWISITKAPLVYNAFAIVLSASAITMTCQKLRLYVPAWVVALSCLAVPTSGEIFGTITNAQWFLQFALGACCLSPASPRHANTLGWLRVIGILSMALTGPFSILLSIIITGMLASSWIARKLSYDPFDGALRSFLSERDWPALLALGLGAIIQTGVLLVAPPTESATHHDLLKAINATFTELVPIHMFGNDFLTGTSWLALYALLIGTLVLSKRIDGHARLQVMGFAVFAILETIASALRITDLQQIYQPSAADRYFYLIKVVWWWVVWLALRSTGSRFRATAIVSALICLVALNNPQFQRRAALSDFSWRDHASDLEQPGTHTIPINPPGWSITIEAKKQQQ